MPQYNALMLHFSVEYDDMMTDALEARTENYRTQPTLQNHGLWERFIIKQSLIIRNRSFGKITPSSFLLNIPVIDNDNNVCVCKL